MASNPSHQVTLRDVDALHRSAACREAEPTLFETTDILTAGPGLAYCSRCPVIPLCDHVIAPRHSRYDGIAAAGVWKEGRRLGGLTGRMVIG